MDREARRKNTRYVINLQTCISIIGLLILIVATCCKATYLRESYSDIINMVMGYGITCILYGAVTPTIIVIIRNSILRKRNKYL